jgi:hypothetical protein
MREVTMKLTPRQREVLYDYANAERLQKATRLP